jgi:hypothetical protein
MPDLHGWITQQIDDVEHAAEADCPDAWAATALRRCAADRKILARHNIDPERAKWARSEAVACRGCGTYGDCDWPVTDNLNDCPELLNLAEGYGLTEDQLAQLDRPELPPREETGGPGKTLSQALTEAFDQFAAEQIEETFLGDVTAHKLTGLMPIAVDLLPPTPLERALDILAPHLRDQPLYRPNGKERP